MEELACRCKAMHLSQESRVCQLLQTREQFVGNCHCSRYGVSFRIWSLLFRLLVVVAFCIANRFHKILLDQSASLYGYACRRLDGENGCRAAIRYIFFRFFSKIYYMSAREAKQCLMAYTFNGRDKTFLGRQNRMRFADTKLQGKGSRPVTG